MRDHLLLHLLVLAGLGLAFGVSPGSAATAPMPGSPVAVSPGSAAGAQIGDPCPSFSWAAVPGAEKFELVAYLVSEQPGGLSGAQGEEAKPVLSETLAGSASSWTPSLDQCFAPGRRYAWSIRALGAQGTSEWSSPSLFEVATEPTEARFEQALEVIQRYLAVREGETAPEPRGRIDPPAESQDQVAALVRGAVSGDAPALRASPAGTLMSVDGNVDAVSYSGSASLLTDLGPDPPCFSETHRFANCGNGTVTDSETGLIWLETPGCQGQQLWQIANLLATTLAAPFCNLSDGSQPGDWRLPTREEWESILEPTCTTAPEIAGNGSPTPGCYSDDPPASEWASGVISTTYWSSTNDVALTNAAIAASTNSGSVFATFKGNNIALWPVRGGQ